MGYHICLYLLQPNPMRSNILKSYTQLLNDLDFSTHIALPNNTFNQKIQFALYCTYDISHSCNIIFFTHCNFCTIQCTMLRICGVEGCALMGGKELHANWFLSVVRLLPQ